ncbi:MAG TPA: nicotinamide riboside transporter PnuC [Gemmatimonadaceae bacterium]|nr:nicotinamide riboside transporter PnuC [Gemmatimonadaceae bacterium]
MTSLCVFLTAHGSSCLELVAVLFGVVSVFLSVRENIWSWPTALVNVALYFALFYRTGLYSDMWLQAVYFALSIYGWYEWLHGGAGRTALTVTRTPLKLWGILAVVGTAFWAVDGAVMARAAGSALPHLDAATATVSLVAQYLMTRKLLENWALWIGVDLVYVGMFIYKGLYLTAGNYAIYLVLAVLGHLAWRRSLAVAAADPAPAAA